MRQVDAAEAQRLQRKSDEIRESRARRTAELSGDPDEDPTVQEGAIADEDSVIARSEALSAVRTIDDMRGLPVERAVYENAESTLVDLGRDLGEQVEERLTEFRDEFAANIQQIEGTRAGSSKGFIYGAGFGAAVFGLGVAAALAAFRVAFRPKD